MSCTRCTFNDNAFKEFDEEVLSQNFTTAKQLSGAGLIVSTCLVLLDIFMSFSKGSFFIYLSWFMACLILFIATKTFVAFTKRHSTIILYIFLIWVTITSIISGTILFRENNSVVVIGYLCIIPFILLDRISRFCIFEVFMCTMFCATSLMVKNFSIAFIDCIQAAGFTLLACILGSNTIKMKLTAIESTAAIITQRDTDPLTNLSTRRASEHIVNHWLESGTGQSVFALLDLDHFKTINDSLGHLQGDQVLSRAAISMRRFVRSSDCVSRLGGDEFLIFLPDVKDLHSVEERLESIIKDFYSTITQADSCYVISVSAGMTICKPGEAYDAIYQRADKALYRAKTMGRNQLCIFENDNQDSHGANSLVETRGKK